RGRVREDVDGIPYVAAAEAHRGGEGLRGIARGDREERRNSIGRDHLAHRRIEVEESIVALESPRTALAQHRDGTRTDSEGAVAHLAGIEIGRASCRERGEI